ncbi:MAG: hypothetical protein QXK80_00215 [Candidatus Pacearchaeota archaeon]
MNEEINKKLFWGYAALILAIVIIIILIILVSSQPKEKEKITLKDGTILSSEYCNKLPKIMIIHMTGCSACAIAVPRLQELERELNLSFSYYDLAIEKDKEAVLNLNLIPEAVPTVIIDCKTYVGVKSKEEYKNAIINQNG